MLSELQVSQLFDPEAHVNAKVKKTQPSIFYLREKKTGW